MSSDNKRPSMESTKFNFKKLFDEIRENITSIRQGMVLASISSILLGFIVWIFFRDISVIGLYMMLAGLLLTFIIGFISWKNIIFFIFGRRGRYGINTSIIFMER